MMGYILCCCVNFDIDAFHATIVLSSNALVDALTIYNNFNHLRADIFTGIASVHVSLNIHLSYCTYNNYKCLHKSPVCLYYDMVVANSLHRRSKEPIAGP